MEDPVYLSGPGCAARCALCLRDCAVLKIQLKLWEKRELRLLRASHARPVVCGKLLRQFSEAQDKLRQLRQEIRLVQQRLPAWAYAAAKEGAPRAASLH